MIKKGYSKAVPFSYVKNIVGFLSLWLYNEKKFNSEVLECLIKKFT